MGGQRIYKLKNGGHPGSGQIIEGDSGAEMDMHLRQIDWVLDVSLCQYTAITVDMSGGAVAAGDPISDEIEVNCGDDSV